MMLHISENGKILILDFWFRYSFQISINPAPFILEVFLRGRKVRSRKVRGQLFSDFPRREVAGDPSDYLGIKLWPIIKKK